MQKHGFCFQECSVGLVVNRRAAAQYDVNVFDEKQERPVLVTVCVKFYSDESLP